MNRIRSGSEDLTGKVVAYVLGHTDNVRDWAPILTRSTSLNARESRHISVPKHRNTIRNPFLSTNTLAPCYSRTQLHLQFSDCLHGVVE